MSRNEEFSKCAECGEPGEHIHFSQQDLDSFRGWSQAGQMAAEVDKHMRTAPTDVRDHAALKAHMLSSGHYAHPLDVHEMTHDDLKAHHEEDHANMDKGPEDEREHYTDLGFEHFHNG